MSRTKHERKQPLHVTDLVSRAAVLKILNRYHHSDSDDPVGDAYEEVQAMLGVEAQQNAHGRVLGCVRCGKPCALVGDKVPVDELCPWCRASDSPGVTARRDAEERALDATPPAPPPLAVGAASSSAAANIGSPFGPKNEAEAAVYDEERFRFHVQHMVQTRLNHLGLTQRDLAQRMGVSEARISQMLSDEANLTTRNIGRIFHELECAPRLAFDDPAPSPQGMAPPVDAPSPAQLRRIEGDVVIAEAGHAPSLADAVRRALYNAGAAAERAQVVAALDVWGDDSARHFAERARGLDVDAMKVSTRRAAEGVVGTLRDAARWIANGKHVEAAEAAADGGEVGR